MLNSIRELIHYSKLIQIVFVFNQLIHIMTDLYLQDAWNYYKQLYDVMLNSTRRVQLTSQLTQELQKTFAVFAKNLQVVTEKFNMEILKESQGQNEKLLNSYQFFSNSLLKISDSYRKISLKIKNQVVDPFLMFIENYRQTNRTVAKRASDMLSDMDKQKTTLSKSQQQYYQSWQKAEKSKQDIEKAIEKIQKGGKNNDLLKANDVSLKLRIIVQEHERDYKENIDKINSKWKILNKEMDNLITLFQYNQQSRLSFSRSTILNAFRVFTQFNQIIDPDIEKKAKQSEQLLKGSKKVPLAQSIGNGKLQKFLKIQKKQHFTTFQDSKKKKQNKKQQKGDIPKDIFKAVTEKQRQQIQKLLKIWFADHQQNIKLTKQLDKVRLSIISSPVHSFYFLESLFNKVHKINQYYCKLEQEHFNQLTNVFVLISRSIQNGNEKSIVYLYKMITISMRIMKKKKDKTGQPRELLCTAFGKDNKIFTNQKLWLSILDHIKIKSSKKNKEPQTSSRLGSILAKGFSNLVGMGQQDEQPDAFQPIQQLTTLFSSLSVPTEFSLPLVKKLLQGQGGNAFEFLKQSLYSKQDIQLRQKLTQNKQIRLQKQNKQLYIMGNKLTAIHALKLIAKRGFFGVEDIKLRLLCKKLSHIHKYILFKLDIPHKWIRIVDAKPIDYISMKTVVAQNSSPSSVEEIISLDVNRSLHIHAKYLNPTLLHTLLRTFAFYNKNISYCQGMNYLAGYLFIKTREQQQAYRIFERLMLDKFSQLFHNEFEILKLKMYQFQRLLNIYLPDLADHFKKQMISSECYIVSWIITLYSATYQYTLNSYLVDVLWDRFIIWGWKEFFKFTLWIFNLFKEELVELSFDKALNFLGELTKSEIFISSKQQLLKNKRFDVRTINQQLDFYHITNHLLQKLKKQYEISLQMAKN